MSLLESSTILLGAAIVAVPLFKRLGLGSVLGYLAAGVALGPTGFAVVGHPEELLHISELGVVLLLFLIGLELDPARLWAMRNTVFGLGAAQVVATAVAVGAGLVALGVGVLPAVVLGGGLALSSTAFAIQALRERGELATPHGRAGFGVLLFQDLAVIPMLAVVPLLAPAPADGGLPWWMQAGIAVGAILGLVLVGRFLLRPLLKIVARTNNRELSVAVALFVVVGAAVAMTAAGLSMGLGAFLAGMMLASTEYRHEMEANIEPFQGLLLGLFFMSVGMTADVRAALAEPALVIGAAVALVALKGALLYGLARGFGVTNRAALRFAVLLSQGGEFGFVLFDLAARLEVLPEIAAQRALVVVTLSMVTTPLLLLLVDALARRAGKAAEPVYETEGYDENPVVIAGFGRYGQMTGRTLRMLGIPFTALEIDADHIDFVKQFGNKLYYGDARRLDLLRAAKVGHAKLFVLAVDDPEASVQIARLVRANFPNVEIVARARNRTHAFALLDAGVVDVRRETLGSALETAERVLVGLGRSPEDAQDVIRRFRAHDEETLALQAQVWGDDAKVVETTRESARRLERLFVGDRGA
jgi:monovalent cation:proton antiporter-2 (CPA2) family protein